MLIIKLSGKALYAQEQLQTMFHALKGQNAVLVHGGGVEVDKMLSDAGLHGSKKDGIRVSPKEHMPYITAALAGLCNKRLQSAAVASGLKAFGMLCTDFDVCSLSPYPAEYGQVAHCSALDCSALVHLSRDAGLLPVICSIGMDPKGDLYNINADEVASALAIALKAPLFFLSDVKGVLDAKGRLIPEIDGKTCAKLCASRVITDGMAVKVKNALSVAAVSGRSVYIASVFDPDLASGLLSQRRIGTELKA